MTTLERFMKHVRKTNSCWIWVGNKDDGGYGRFVVKGKRVRAHRFIFGKEVPKGKDLAHSCENPSCVNPKHLIPQTRSENMKTAFCNGRFPEPLSESKVREIFEACKQVKYNRRLAVRFGVSGTTIHRIRHGRTSLSSKLVTV